jgi:hypothetical protein
MKKVLFSVAVVAAFGLASCGGDSLCDCVDKIKNAKDMDELKKMESCVKQVADAKPEDLEKCSKKEEEKK